MKLSVLSIAKCAALCGVAVIPVSSARAQGLVQSSSSRQAFVTAGSSALQPPPPAEEEAKAESQLDPDYVSDEAFEAAKRERDSVQRNREFGEPGVDTRQSFLRTVTPLLQAGRAQWDFGFQYSIFEADFPTISGVTLTEENVTSRRLETPLGFRFGVTNRLQYFANIPVGWQESQAFDGFTERTQNASGVGDFATGFNFLLRSEDRCGPAIISSTDVTMPTGNAINPLFLSSAGMGLGAWTTSGSLLMVRTLDPVVVFWGGGYRFTFEDTYEANQIDLGDQILYSCGVGFAANERVTLSTALIGSYVTDLAINGNTIDGTGYDLARIRMAATIINCGKISEPFVEFGITDRAPTATMGVVFTR